MKDDGIAVPADHPGGSIDVTDRIGEVDNAQWSAWLLVGFLSLLYIFSFLDRTVIALMVTPIRRDLHISDVQISLLVGMAFVLFYSVMALPMGWLVDKYPRRLIIFAGVSIWSIAQTACAFAGSFAQLFAARLFLGAGEATLNPATHSFISDAFPRRQLATAMSVYSLGATMGIGFALLIGGAIVGALSNAGTIMLPVFGSFHSWQLVFLATGLPGLALVSFIFAFPEPQRRLRSPAEHAPMKESGFLRFLRRNWQLWLCLALSFGVMNIANGAMVFWQPAYLERFFHFSPRQAATVLGVTQLLAGTAGMLFSGRTVDRMFSRGIRDAHLRYYANVLVATTPVVLFSLLVNNIWLYLGLSWIATFVTVNSLGYSVAAVMLTTPARLRGRASAVFTSLIVAGLGQGLGPLVPALLAQHVFHDTQRLGYAIAGTICACAVVAIAALHRGMPLYRAALDRQGA